MSTRVLWHPAHLHRGALHAPAGLDRLTGIVKSAVETVRTWRRRARERAPPPSATAC